MTRRDVTIHMSAPTFLARVWYRRLGETPPSSEGTSGPRSAHLVRLLPYRWRRFHHAYAAFHSFFWLPCPLCGHEFGGHESGGSIPDPLGGVGRFIGICSQCTISQGHKP